MLGAEANNTMAMPSPVYDSVHAQVPKLIVLPSDRPH